MHLVCIRQADTWRWPEYLGKQTAGICSQCQAPIYFQERNAHIEPKVCGQCAGIA